MAQIGCGFSLAQTAKTLPAAEGNVSVGGGAFVSDVDADRGGWRPQHNLSSELGGRFGVGKQVDLGFTGYLGIGGLVDAKWSLLPQERREAVALRVGAGAGMGPGSENKDVVAQVGVIGSYDFTRWFSPYLSVMFSNHWVFAPTPTDPLPAGTTYAPRAGYGDGILELHAGLAFLWGSRQRGIYAEYIMWQPLQDDPGDFFKFARTHIFEVVARF